MANLVPKIFSFLNSIYLYVSVYLLVKLCTCINVDFTAQEIRSTIEVELVVFNLLEILVKKINIYITIIYPLSEFGARDVLHSNKKALICGLCIVSIVCSAGMSL